MYVKKLYNDKGAVRAWAIGHTGTHPRQNFRQQDIQEGLAGGYMAIADGRLTIKAEPENLTYTIVRGPGHWCLHCGARIQGGGESARGADGKELLLADGATKVTVAMKHVLDAHPGTKSPDPSNPAGFAWLKHYECVIEPAQHERFKAQPGDLMTVDHIKREAARRAKSAAASKRAGG